MCCHSGTKKAVLLQMMKRNLNIATAVHQDVCGGAVMVWYWCDVAYFIFVVVMKKAVLLCEC